MKTVGRTAQWGRRALLAALLGGAAAFGGGTNAQADDAPTATTDRGDVLGLQLGAVQAFLGVPYASAPVGDLRFRPPRRHAPWSEPLEATRVAPPCPQVRPTNTGSEDCLYLNVWRPAQAAAEARPVMVYFPGGGFTQGSASSPYYDGRYMAEQGGVVVVTVTYRVGALGFLAAPALDAESRAGVSGNYGIQDQQAALRWIRRNIAGFGGNPRNVTIFGESAGANSVEYHLVSPGSSGLFDAAIVQSAAGLKLIPDLPIAQAEAGGSASVIEGVGCADVLDVSACLRGVPAYDFLGVTGSTLPIVDGVVVPQEPTQAFRSGQFNRVPVIIGSNHDEETALIWSIEAALGGPLTESGYVAEVTRFYGADAEAVLAEYSTAAYPTPIQALAAAETDSNFACPTAEKRSALSRHVPVFGYELNEPNPANGPLLGPPEPGLDYGDYHTADLPYVFGVAAPNGVRLTAAKDLSLSRRVIRYWTNFAITGDPNFPGFRVPIWLEERPFHQLLSFKDSIGYLSERQFNADHHCYFWANRLEPSR